MVERLLQGGSGCVERLPLHRQHSLQVRVTYPSNGGRRRIPFDNEQLGPRSESMNGRVDEFGRAAGPTRVAARRAASKAPRRSFGATWEWPAHPS